MNPVGRLFPEIGQIAIAEQTFSTLKNTLTDA
jgi:hypothetical protein